MRDGDAITLDIEARKLELHVDDATLAARKAQWMAPAPAYDRGYGLLFLQSVLQADQGCDFDFLLPPELRDRK